MLTIEELEKIFECVSEDTKDTLADLFWSSFIGG